MIQFMWTEDVKDKEMKSAAKKVETFFDNIRTSNQKLANGVKLVYRKEQHHFARNVMTAIRDNQILLVQAGVGTGKSMGYLIPIFYTREEGKNSNREEGKKFNNVVISTSSIALQQQLLTDINFISKLLGFEIKAEIAKGANNYACLRNIDKVISQCDIETKKELLKLRNEIESKQTIDKDKLTEISNKAWEKIRVGKRGSCSGCTYSRDCLYRTITKNVTKADVVITNHGNFAKSVIDDRDYINNADMFIFDEAHKLEEAIRGINEGLLNISDIRSDINYYINNFILNRSASIEIATQLIGYIDQLFSEIRRKASGYFNKNNQNERNINITDSDKIPIQTHDITPIINHIIRKLERLIKEIDQLGYCRNDQQLINLTKYLKIFKDMAKGKNSENIYWADYYQKNKIHIGYASKSNINITENIFTRNIPIVLTSGTLLDANGSYNYLKKGLSFDKIVFKNQSVVDGRVYPSPYDYEKNSLFYYDPTMANPKEYNEYVKDLVLKISELIRTTNGRTLVLFTAKSTMNDVYNLIQQEDFDFKLMIQGSMSESQLCKKFESDVKSCLFATGAFWEGIDIAGKSLCNVIITRLPFDNVDAISQNKASQFSKEEAFKMVYLNNMAQKMAQGTGRLIRGKSDKGIICCLDSRCVKYLEVIKNCTPYCNFTSDINDVYEFAKKNITNRDGKRKAKLKEQ